jgi:hypothetical protein
MQIATALIPSSSFTYLSLETGVELALPSVGPDVTLILCRPSNEDQSLDHFNTTLAGGNSSAKEVKRFSDSPARAGTVSHPMTRVVAPLGAPGPSLLSDRPVIIPADRSADRPADDSRLCPARCICVNLCERLTRKATQWSPLSLAKPCRVLVGFPDPRGPRCSDHTKCGDCEQTRALERRVA